MTYTHYIVYHNIIIYSKRYANSKIHNFIFSFSTIFFTARHTIVRWFFYCKEKYSILNVQTHFFTPCEKLKDKTIGILFLPCENYKDNFFVGLDVFCCRPNRF